MGPSSAGVYRVRLETPDSKARKFKLLLFVGPPDRLHGEIVSPVGTTLMVFDGGAGRLAVTYVRDRTTFVGESTVSAIEHLFGVPVSMKQLVDALWAGEPLGPDVQLLREGPVGGVPIRFEIISGRRRLTLELKRHQTLRGSADAIGNGVPPERTQVRPLDELLLQIAPLAEGAD